jgi:hypothetical protein
MASNRALAGPASQTSFHQWHLTALSLDYLQSQKCTGSSPWNPKTLSYSRSNHPLDRICTDEDLTLIRTVCQLPPTTSVVSQRGKPQNNITVQELRSILHPESPVNQQILNLYLHLFSTQFNTEFLDSCFFSLLRDNGWVEFIPGFFPLIDLPDPLDLLIAQFYPFPVTLTVVTGWQ